jgi:hypothetical protein
MDTSANPAGRVHRLFTDVFSKHALLGVTVPCNRATCSHGFSTYHGANLSLAYLHPVETMETGNHSFTAYPVAHRLLAPLTEPSRKCTMNARFCC